MPGRYTSTQPTDAGLRPLRDLAEPPEEDYLPDETHSRPNGSKRSQPRLAKILRLTCRAELRQRMQIRMARHTSTVSFDGLLQLLR